MKPTYLPNTAKSLEVILWLANRQPGIDLYHIVKAAYYADKEHLNAYGRPICGDRYNAAPYGPLPRVIYGLLRGDPIELLALGGNGDLPFEIRNRVNVYAMREANLRKLSRTDVQSLESGWRHVEAMSFDALVRETHADPAYLNADGGMMDYRDLLDGSGEDLEGKCRFIEETAASAVL